MDKCLNQPLSAKEAVAGRRSIRRFLPDPIPQETIEAILDQAARAPSGTNSQPWHVHVVSGAARDRLCKAVTAAAEAGEESEEYLYSPKDKFEPHLTRRRTVGFALYGILGIERHDMAARKAQHLRNYELFDAPVGLFFTMDRRLEFGSWLDMGMFLQNVMIIARAHGYETCPQASWLHYGGVVHKELGIPDGHILLSGMALGVGDPEAPENELITEREAAANFTHFHTD